MSCFIITKNGNFYFDTDNRIKFDIEHFMKPINPLHNLKYCFDFENEENYLDLFNKGLSILSKNGYQFLQIDLCFGEKVCYVIFDTKTEKLKS